MIDGDADGFADGCASGVTEGVMDEMLVGAKVDATVVLRGAIWSEVRRPNTST